MPPSRTRPTLYHPSVKPSWQEIQAATRDGRWLRHPLGNGLILSSAAVEGAGSKTVDMVKGRSGAITSGTWTVMPGHGTGIKYNGSSSGVYFSDDAALDPTFLSVSAWCIQAGASGAQDIVCKCSGASGSQRQFELRTGTGTPAFMVYDSAGTATIATAGSALSLATLYHLVGTWDGTKSTLYVNGVQQASTSGARTLNSTNGPLAIGRFANFNAQYFNGSIGLVQVWNRVLSASEVAWLYAEPFAMLRPPRQSWLMAPAAGGGTVALTATLAGVGSLTAIPYITLTATLAGVGAVVANPTIALTATLAGVGSLAANLYVTLTATLAGAGALAANLIQNPQALSATLAGAGSLVANLTGGALGGLFFFVARRGKGR